MDGDAAKLRLQRQTLSGQSESHEDFRVFRLTQHSKILRGKSIMPFLISPLWWHRGLLDCASKGVKVAHIFTSGFAEVGSEEGKRLQQEIRNPRSHRDPNNRTQLHGGYSPEGGVSFANFPGKTGPSALISQTGAGAARTIIYGSNRGIYFGKAISYGNAVDLDSPDFRDVSR